MVGFLNSLRVIVGIILLMAAIHLSFRGFGFGAFLSLFGSFLVLWGWQISIACALHKMAYGGNAKSLTDNNGAPFGLLQRLSCIVFGFALAWLGSFCIESGGLAVININNFSIHLGAAGAGMGIVCGIWNVDRTLIN